MKAMRISRAWLLAILMVLLAAALGATAATGHFSGASSASQHLVITGSNAGSAGGANGATTSQHSQAPNSVQIDITPDPTPAGAAPHVVDVVPSRGGCSGLGHPGMLCEPS
jgi:hypothetical protein